MKKRNTAAYATGVSLIATALYAATACTSTKVPTHMKVKPIDSGLRIETLTDCTVAACFTADDFNWNDRTLTCDVFTKCLYAAADVERMQTGDTLVYEGKDIVTASIEDSHGGRIINGGIEEGGAELTPDTGRTYRTLLMDDHTDYDRIGKARLLLAKDFTIIDCGDDYSDPYDTVSTAQKAYIDSMPQVRRDYFNCLNTELVIEKGAVKLLRRRWIP